MTQYDDPSSRAGRSALLATGIAAAGAAALIFLPKVRRALADTIDLAEETARRWYGAAEEVADEFTARTAGRREAEPEADREPVRPPRPKAAAPKAAAPKAAAPKKAATKKATPKKAASKKGPAKKASAVGGTTRSTSPGHVNPRGQTVVRRVGKSPSWKGQYTYELACSDCGHHYGANGPDIDRADGGEGRACPKCQGGPEGDPIS